MDINNQHLRVFDLVMLITYQVQSLPWTELSNNPYITYRHIHKLHEHLNFVELVQNPFTRIRQDNYIKMMIVWYFQNLNIPGHVASHVLKFFY